MRINAIEFGDDRLPYRFWDNAVLTDVGCWQWIGRISSDGYGTIDTHRKRAYAHRYGLKFLLAVPDGMCADHLCRNRSCVNPAHLEIVTNRENVLRGVGTSAVNARKTHCYKGHEFTEENTHRPRPNARSCRACQREYDASRKSRSDDKTTVAV